MSPKIRERHAVLLLPEGVGSGSFDPGSPPGIGLLSEWVPCANPRVLTLKYGAKEGENLPQAKAVKSALAAWAKSRGLKKSKVAVLDCIDGNEIDRFVQAWDIRQGSIGSNVTLAYSVALPKRIESVDLTRRLGWLAEKALPWMNQRLRELHREEVLEAAPGWSKPVWKHGDLGFQAEWTPSRVGRCLLETAGRLTVSQGMRRQAFTALAAVEQKQKENFLEQGRLYPLVLEARALWETAHKEDNPPKAGFLLGVAEQMHTDYRRRAERKWNGFTWAGYPPAGWVRRLYTESRRLHR